MMEKKGVVEEGELPKDELLEAPEPVQLREKKAECCQKKDCCSKETDSKK